MCVRLKNDVVFISLLIMELNEKFMEVIFHIIIKQNTELLQEVARRENIPFKELREMFLKTPRKKFKAFMSQIQAPLDSLRADC